MEKIVLGGGCFWCLDASYRMLHGVEGVVSGFAGGTAQDADYYTVASGQTKHAEVVEVTYNPQEINLETILEVFWTIHDPTTLNRQGNDVGPQYRSAIFYASPAQEQVAQASLAKVQQHWDQPIITEIVPLEKFFPAGEEHQEYFQKHPEKAYCQVVINPKLQKLRAHFTSLLRD